MRTSSAKAKGRRLQQLIKSVLLEHFHMLEEDDVKTAIMGESGVDIHLSPSARRLFPYSIECKNVEKINIWSALAQAQENTKSGTVPLLAFSRNRTPEPYVALKLSDFMKLISQPPVLESESAFYRRTLEENQQIADGSKLPPFTTHVVEDGNLVRKRYSST